MNSIIPSETYIITHLFIIGSLCFAATVGTVLGHVINKKFFK